MERLSAEITETMCSSLTESAGGDHARSSGNAEVAEEAAAQEPPFQRHVLRRTIVLPEFRILFLPVPKAGWTSILWVLAAAARVPPETFADSDLPAPSPALTIHDMTRWSPEHRFGDYEDEERERVLASREWFRFSVVRDPATRLWSAWQSKLLLREPRFVAMFGESPWFPRVPQLPGDIVEDFRRFASAVTAGEADDVHWARQVDLVSKLSLTHVGRLEQLDETLALLRDRVPADRWPEQIRQENRTLLARPTTLYDQATAAAVNAHYAEDLVAFGYDPVAPAAGADEEWEAHAEALLPAIHETIERHERIGQLQTLAHKARRVEPLERRLESISTRVAGRSSAPVLTNLEDETDFTVRWAWAESETAPGFTAVVRVKNEARSLPWVLPPLMRAVERTVLVDNGSTDGTPDVALRVAEEAGLAQHLEVVAYPFSVARCGQEHLDTPPASVHSLAYFYNWAFSHVRTRYALKWDGDMVLSDAGAEAFRDLAWQLEAAEVVLKVPRYPFYVADERRGFLDVGLRNAEPWAWPNRPGYSFVKAMEWELPLWPSDIPHVQLPEWSCIEIKYLDEDEFAHWSSKDFDSVRQQRKRREWEVFNTLASGAAPPAGVIPIEAPGGEHVVDYVRATWLAERAARGPGLAERVLRQLADVA